MANTAPPTHSQATTYAVSTNEGSGFENEVQSSHTDLTSALKALKGLRKQFYDSFIAPATPAERYAFPYRNKIGPLRDPVTTDNYWGYRFIAPNTADIISVWIEKTNAGSTLRQDLQATAQIKEAVKKFDIDYVAYGQTVGASLTRLAKTTSSVSGKNAHIQDSVGSS